MTDTGKKYKYRVGITDADIKNATQGNTEGPPRITDSPISWRKSESAEDSFQSWISNRGNTNMETTTEYLCPI